MAASAQGVSADELVSNEAATTEGKPSPSWKAPEVAVAEKSVAPVASNYAAPANVTEQSVAPASKVAASESGTPSVEKATEASMTEKEETLFRLIQEARLSLTRALTLQLVVQQMWRFSQNHSLMWVAITETLVLETTVP